MAPSHTSTTERQVANAFGVSKSSLQCHDKKYSEAPNKDSIIFHCNLVCGLVFSEVSPDCK